MYWISKEWVILLCRIWPTLVFLILQKIVFWFFRDFSPILKKIVFWFIRKSFLIFSRFYSDFGENRFLIFSWFLETRFIKLICIRKNTEKIVCKSRDFNTILSTIYSTIFLVWVKFVPSIWFPCTIYTITCITRLRSTIQIKYVMFPMIISASLMKPNIQHLYLNPLCSLYLTPHVLT